MASPVNFRNLPRSYLENLPNSRKTKCVVDMQTKNAAKKTMAVSPIVATLVLIVVAVVGAVAVGTIMGTFSQSVSKQADAGQAASASQTELLTAGSTTVYPASLQIAKLFMEQHPGVKITVQGGGSGAGVAATGAGTVDIGASSDLSKITGTGGNADHPDWNLEYTQIGCSGIFVVGGTNANLTSATFTSADIKTMFNVGGVSEPAAFVTAGINEVVTRSDASGTADTFYKALGYSGQQIPNVSGVSTVSASGNEGVLAEIASHPNAIGFLDMGYAIPALGTTPATGIQILTVDDSAKNIKSPGGNKLGFGPATPTVALVKTACQDLQKSTANPPDIKAGDYPLVRGLYYFTKGNPSPIENSYISFAASPGACTNPAGTEGIHNAGVFCMADLT